MQLTEKHKQYWQKKSSTDRNPAGDLVHRHFCYRLYARDLQSFTVLGFPFSFYMGAQGSLIIYVLIIWY